MCTENTTVGIKEGERGGMKETEKYREVGGKVRGNCLC